MIELFLIVALAIAIVLDIIRIVQYVQLRKYDQEKSKQAFQDRLRLLYSKWWHEEESKGMSVEYIIEHWEDKV